MNWQNILVVLLIVHWACDFTPLSTPWMLSAKRHGWPVHPIFCHAFTHALMSLCSLTLVFAAFYRAYYSQSIPESVLIYLFLSCIFLLLTHWAIDITKGAVARFWPVSGDNTKSQYWQVFGLDQLAHLLILVLITTRLMQWVR